MRRSAVGRGRLKLRTVPVNAAVSVASATGAATPKGQVEVTFPQKGGKVVKAMQGDALGAVCKKAGVRIKFDCKNGRCGTCQVRINGRSAAKVCQGAKVPGGATRKITLTLDNP